MLLGEAKFIFSQFLVVSSDFCTLSYHFVVLGDQFSRNSLKISFLLCVHVLFRASLFGWQLLKNLFFTLLKHYRKGV